MEMDTFTCDFHSISPFSCDRDNMTHIYECDKDTSGYLRGLKCSEVIPGLPFESYTCPESLLILYRSGIFTIDKKCVNLKICENHRSILGLNWRRGKVLCSYPDHHGGNSKADRGACPSLCKEIYMQTRQVLPVGSGICKRCQTKHRQNVQQSIRVKFKEELDSLQHFVELAKGSSQNEDEENEATCMLSAAQDLQNELDSELSYQLSGTTTTDDGSQYLSSQDWFEAQRTPREKLNAAMKLLSEKFEPLQSQLTRPFESLGKSMKSYYLKKADECVHMVLGIIAPDQESVILSALQSKTMKAETDITTLTAETDMTTKSIISAYHNAADGRTQTQILSLIANNHTKTKLQELIPGISTFKIDNARKHALVQGPGLILSQPKVYRIKLTKPKLNHFIEFILNPTYSSIVGFGQTTLRLSSNAKIEVPKIIRNVISSRIINTYTAYCLENDFPCFSRASLYRILKVCYASKQKALQGLDNITASGLNAVDILHKIVSKLEAYGITQGESKNLNDILHLVNQFLKFEYKMHLCKLDGCVDHCTVFGLSDPLEPKFSSACSHTHEITCDKCSMVESSIHIIREKMHSVFVHVPDSIQEELTHDIDVAEKDLLDWKKHIMRTLHQDKAKTEVLQSMNSDQGLIIMDWAMKYLPFQFRETQSDFFGKRGMSWHVSCLVTKSSNEDEDLDLQSYIHIFENGSQGWFSVANILLHLFDHLSVSKPELKEVFLKSDNAACYHCSNLLGFLQQNNSMFPIQVKQYNFSEPQSGKDLCDSKTGSCRLHMLKHTNEGNNILSPQDMKMALESHGGVKGTQASVVTVPNETEAKTRYKIPQITTLNNFTFTEEGIVARKAYSIGEGQIIGNTNDINLSIEKVRKMQVLQPFCEGAQLKGKVSLPKRTQDTTALEQDQQEAIDSSMETNCEENCAYFSCPDRSCNKTFAKSCNLERHIQVGTHTYENTMPGMDMAITIYAEKTETMKQYQNSILVENQQCYSSIDQEDDKKGWALKSKRQASRFSPKVKDYIKSVCVSCEKSGNRPDVYALSEELKKVTDENGQKLFKQCEWLSPNQIRGCIAQFLTKMKKGPSEPKKSKVCAEEISKTEVDDDALLEVVEMLNESELGENVCGLVSEVFSVIGT